MRRTNFRFLRYSRDDVVKLTCTSTHRGHASTPVVGEISEKVFALLVQSNRASETLKKISSVDFLTLDESTESRDTHRAASREAVYRYVSFISWYSGKSMPVKST